MRSAIPKRERQFFVGGILEWGKHNYRCFPWRQVADPFLTLLAEVLLCRTPASRVAPIYSRLADRYGSAELLADAPTHELAAELALLGLQNRRAQQLVAIARLVLRDHAGEVPCSAAALTDLPGVGRYTANALLCFASDQPVPIVDGNIGRVLTRFFALRFRRRASLDKGVWQFAATLVPPEPHLAKAYNYALLDFASEVCRKRPACPKCPLASACAHLRSDDTACRGSLTQLDPNHRRSPSSQVSSNP